MILRLSVINMKAFKAIHFLKMQHKGSTLSSTQYERAKLD